MAAGSGEEERAVAVGFLLEGQTARQRPLGRQLGAGLGKHRLDRRNQEEVQVYADPSGSATGAAAPATGDPLGATTAEDSTPRWPREGGRGVRP